MTKLKRSLRQNRAMFGAAMLSVRLFVVAGLLFSVWSPRAWARNEDYVSDVRAERLQKERDLVWAQRPEAETELRHRIFNEELSREFRDRYEQKFGRTEIERVFQAPNRLSYYNDAYGVRGTPQELGDERRRFGEFMIRRLTEWHVENYAKNDPKVRPVWEAKEKISKLKVEVASFRFDAQYSIAGNTLDMKLVNPWVESKVTLLMNPDQFGPGPVNETLVSVFRSITPKYALESRWRVSDGILALIQHRSLGRGWGGSLTTSFALQDGGTSPRETLWLAGVGRAF
ncbi:MAG: hypothetical protein JNJ49_14665 [Bdellovibrionaceae bacterium]|nr:hypothetical protein [Pseudobdellovibrionaceae bacterium]